MKLLNLYTLSILSRLEISSGFKCTLWVAVDLLNIEEFFKKTVFPRILIFTYHSSNFMMFYSCKPYSITHQGDDEMNFMESSKIHFNFSL